MPDKTVRLRVDKELWKLVSKVAIDLEVTKSTLVSKALKAYIATKVKQVEKIKKVRKVRTAKKVKK